MLTATLTKFNPVFYPVFPFDHVPDRGRYALEPSQGLTSIYVELDNYLDQFATGQTFCIQTIPPRIVTTAVSQRRIYTNHDGTRRIFDEKVLPVPSIVYEPTAWYDYKTVQIYVDYNTNGVQLGAEDGIPPGGGLISENNWIADHPHIYEAFVRFDYTPKWKLRDGTIIYGNTTKHAVTGYEGSVPDGWVVQPDPTVPPPPITKTTPFYAFRYDGNDPTHTTTARIGVYTDGGIHDSVWQPSIDAAYKAELGDWQDTIGWNFEVSDMVDVNVDVPPVGTTPVILFGRHQFHAWTGDVHKSPSDFVGYLYHTDDARANLTPPVGFIYPFYTSERVIA